VAASVDFGAGVIRVFRTVGSRGLSGFCPSRLRLGCPRGWARCHCVTLVRCRGRTLRGGRAGQGLGCLRVADGCLDIVDRTAGVYM